jgi:hypothetical protein
MWRLAFRAHRAALVAARCALTLDSYLCSDDDRYSEPDCSGYPMVLTSTSDVW